MHEISLHVLDLVQNSLEAGASSIEIHVEEDLAADLFRVSVKDNGRGMDAETLQQVTDPFYTTRSTRRVGLGLSLLKAAAEQCAGKMIVESQKGVGTTVTAVFRHSHWDRMPLGDMATTIMVILAGHPELVLIYRHQVDGKSFCFQLGEVRQRLENLPVNHPAVLHWLKDYLREAIQNLYGGEFDD
jgi:anti-sigma regulatory factor (Ser/Thr protein kinase)